MNIKVKCNVRQVLTTALLTLVFNSSVANAVQYQIVGLGFAPGFNNSRAEGINSVGDTINSSGNFEGTGLVSAFYNQGGGGAQMVPRLPGYFYSDGVAINDNGLIAVNNRATVDTGYRVVTYDTTIDSLNDLGEGVAVDMNNSGTVLGRSSGKTALYTQNGITVLTGFSSYLFSQAEAINNVGAITGSVHNIGVGAQAFLYSNGTVSELGMLAGATRSYGIGLNDLNQVVGVSTIAGVHSRATLWDNGSMVDLGVLAGYESSGAADINNIGQAVGSSRKGGAIEAVLFENGNTTALIDLLVNGNGWSLTGATAINENGQIVGVGRFNGVDQAFLLTAVPLPGAFWLFASGMLFFIRLCRVR